jgi:hypothetical protein
MKKKHSNWNTRQKSVIAVQIQDLTIIVSYTKLMTNETEVLAKDVKIVYLFHVK